MPTTAKKDEKAKSPAAADMTEVATQQAAATEEVVVDPKPTPLQLAQLSELEELRAYKAKMEATKSAGDANPDDVFHGDPNDIVRVRLFKDDGKYASDLFVSVNMRAYKIQRGIFVSVPRFVAMAIRESETQDAKTAQMITDLQTTLDPTKF